MKTSKYLLILMSIMFAFYACSDDSVSVIDVDPDPDPDEQELDPALVGTWVVDPTAGSLAVGPTADDLSWWSISSGDVTARQCFYEDQYVFGDDGSFQNVLGDETWLEADWQAVDEDGCGAPIAPHDGSNVGEWYVDGTTLTIDGEGNYLGLAKVHNTGENGNPANNRINYTYELSDNDDTLEIRISGWLSDVPEATWYFRLIRQ